MSKFCVEVKTITEVINHPNADKLIIYKVNDLGYQFISSMHYKVGDQVVYFPVDSLLTEPLIELFNLGTLLAGKDNDRVKTVRLRGSVSQGFIGDVVRIGEHLGVPPSQLPLMDLTEALGIIKWEPPPIPCQNGILKKLPPGLSMYDIEGCDNYPAVVQKLIEDETKVLVTEKLEGQNFSVTVNKEGQEWVSQRRATIIEKDEGGMHDMWEVARREHILDLAKEILKTLDAEDVTLYGEHCGPGVQGNYYKLKERTVWYFDMKVNGQWMDAKGFLDILTVHGAGDKIVPILAQDIPLKEFLGEKTMQEASNGKSAIHKERLREGIVIRPMFESQDPSIGRLIIKQRDPIYLDKTGN